MNVKLYELSTHPVPVKLLHYKGLHGPHNSGLFTSGLCISKDPKLSFALCPEIP